MGDLISYTALENELIFSEKLFEINRAISWDSVFEFDPDSNYDTLPEYYDDTKYLKYVFEFGELFLHVNSFNIYWDFEWYTFLQNQKNIFYLIGIHNYVKRIFDGNNSSEIILFRDNSRVSMMFVEELSFDRRLTSIVLSELASASDIWNVNLSNLDSDTAYFVL